MTDPKEATAQFEAFRQVVAALRAEHGCPWDRAQTFDSLKPCMVNEMTEALAGIDLYEAHHDAENLCEELGDVLLQVMLLSQIAPEEGLFSIADVVRGVKEKMIRRHPHVFPPSGESSAGEITGKEPENPAGEIAGKEAENSAGEIAGKEAENSAGGIAGEEAENPAGGIADRESEMPDGARAETAAVSVQEIPGLWEAVKRAEKQGKDPEAKRRERAAFGVAARYVCAQLAGTEKEQPG